MGSGLIAPPLKRLGSTLCQPTGSQNDVLITK